MADDDVVVAKKKRTLLEKYDIPVSHLNYEYVKKCNNGKELERIVKILRSGEEGLYPDLEKCAANRLAEIMPSSRVLRVEEPVLTKNMLEVEHWNQVNNELANWSSEMKTKENELNNAEDSLVTVDMPGVRSEKTTKNMKPKNESKKVKNIVPRDYSEWDKYDADKEILKMDLEEEKKKEELEKKQRVGEKDSVKKSPVSRAKIVGGAGVYSNTEKQFLATQEKDKGNEFFKAREYKEAIEHYSSSIAIEPSPVAYNNRAMAHIKLEQYLEALRDCNKVLELEPNNVKALHRRGIAYKHRGNYQQALDDFLRILQLEPSNRMASSLAQEMQTKVDSNRRSVRMHIAEEESFEDGPKIMELPDESYDQEPCIEDSSAKINTSWPAPPDRRIKCNEFGLPKVMCNCSGVPDWVRRPPPRCLICKEIKERRKAEQAKLKEVESSLKGSETSTHGSEDSDSDEDITCEHVDGAAPTPETVSSIPENETTSHLKIGDTSMNKTMAEVKKDPSTEVLKSTGDTICKEEASVSKAATSKSSVTSPKVKSGRKMEARRLLPPESIKPVKVQVASKYTTKTVVKGEEETTPGVQAIQGLSLEDGNIVKISTPFEFVNALQAAKGEDSALLAPVLRRIDPSDLHTLIGNKLDDVMLHSILECLEKCFIHNGPLILKFLENLATLPRFEIVKMFLNSRTKQGRSKDDLQLRVS
ncbi:FK506-binding protein 59 [Gryllus bimaculatus]|nr:FK506-binding protein 59 [Gryllus bimaculatus]